MTLPWSSGPPLPETPRDYLHLWRVLLDVVPADRSSLSPDELERAEKLVQLEHRQRFIAMRSAVRGVLGSYLQMAPDSIRFAYGKKGKPALLNGQNSLDLRFNVSHSESLGILAVTSGCEVGVDVETRQEVLEFMAVARRFFSRREYQALCELPEGLRQRAFLRCWTRKESYVKALGEGLACSLRSFSVSVSPDVSEQCLLETVSARKHEVSDVDLPDECVASVAVEGTRRPSCCWTYGSREFG